MPLENRHEWSFGLENGPKDPAWRRKYLQI